jgi:proline iminopeptidase
VTPPSITSTGHLGLYPASNPFDEGWLPVTGAHHMHYTQRGNPDGIPVVVIHGGPGSGSSPQQAGFFDPARYRIIQFDQRGSGLSYPRGLIRDNSTAHLLEDIDLLRRHLAVRRWLVVGGSWGATLGALYAAGYRSDVRGVLFRGMFLAATADIRWFFQDAASEFPEAWQRFAAGAPSDRRHELLAWYHDVFIRDFEDAQIDAAQRWHDWERTLSAAAPAPAPDAAALRALCLRYRVQSHYLANQCWLGDTRVIEACASLSGFPVAFLHGELDRVCRVERARLAQQACAGSTFQLASGAGHDPFHPAMVSLMRNSLDRLSRHE